MKLKFKMDNHGIHRKHGKDGMDLSAEASHSMPSVVKKEDHR